MFLYERLLKILIEAGDKGCHATEILEKLDTSMPKLKSQFVNLRNHGFNYRAVKGSKRGDLATYYISIDKETLAKAKKLIAEREKKAEEAIKAIISNKGMTGEDIKKMFNISDPSNLRCLFRSIRCNGYNIENLKPHSSTGFYVINSKISRKPVKKSDDIYFMSLFNDIKENYRFMPEQNDLIEKVFR